MVSGPFLLLGSRVFTSAEVRLLVARLLSDVENNVSTAALPALLTCIERDSGKPVAVPRNHTTGDAAGPFAFLQEAAPFARLFFPAQHSLDPRIPAAVAIVNLVFAAAADEAHGAGGVLEIADQGAGDRLLVQAFGLFFFRADLNDGRSILLDTGLARELRLFV